MPKPQVFLSVREGRDLLPNPLQVLNLETLNCKKDPWSYAASYFSHAKPDLAVALLLIRRHVRKRPYVNGRKNQLHGLKNTFTHWPLYTVVDIHAL